MQAKEISDKIATLKRALKKAKNKEKIQSKIADLELELKDANLTTYELSRMLLGSKVKVNRYTEDEFNKIIDRLSKRNSYSFLSNLDKELIKKDLKRKAKPVGWRFKGDNYKRPTKKDIEADKGKSNANRNTYREYRSNRSDVIKISKLEIGGNLKNNQMKNIENIEPLGYKIENAIDYGKKLVDAKAKTIQIRNEIEKHYPSLKENIQEIMNNILDYKDNKMEKGGGVKENYLKKILSNEKEYKKIWQLEKDIRSLDKKFGVGASHGLQFHIYEQGSPFANSRKMLEVEINNNNGYWDREFNEIKKYDLTQYKKQFSKENFNYQEYKEELLKDINKLVEKIGKISDYTLYGSIVEKTTQESDIPLYLINPSDYEYAYKKAKEKSTKMAHGGVAEAENKEMVLNNNKQIAHHTQELQEAVKGKNVPAWVVAKVNRSASDLSDATHYMEGQSENYANGGGVEEYRKGATIKRGFDNNDQYRYKNESGFVTRHTGEELFDSFDVNQWKHFRYDHQVPDKFSHGYDYKTLPSYIQQKLDVHAKMGQYEKGGNVENRLNEYVEDFGVHYGNNFYLLNLDIKDKDLVQSLIDKGLSPQEISNKLNKFGNGGVGGTFDSSSTGIGIGGTDSSSETGTLIGGTAASSMATGGPIKAQQNKVAKVMHEWKEGELNIGKSDKKVKSQKQAVAIALSEAGLSKKEGGGSISTLGLSGVKRYATKNGYSIKTKKQGMVTYVYLTKDGKTFGPIDPTIATLNGLERKLNKMETGGIIENLVLKYKTKLVGKNMIDENEEAKIVDVHKGTGIYSKNHITIVTETKDGKGFLHLEVDSPNKFNAFINGEKIKNKFGEFSYLKESLTKKEDGKKIIGWKHKNKK